jgi:hypothetical protein
VTRPEPAPTPAPTQVPPTAPVPLPRTAGLLVGPAADPVERDADRMAKTALARLRPGPIGDEAAPVVRRTGGSLVVRRVASVYQTQDDLRGMTLSAFDSYARTQVDWAVSVGIGTDKDGLRALLALARAADGRVLGACGAFTVGALLTAGVGAGTHDAALGAYSRAAGTEADDTSIVIRKPAATVTEAIAWGAAIITLSATILGPVLHVSVPQSPGVESLKALVDAGAVADFATYVAAVQPVLDSVGGADVSSYLAFRAEGGMGRYAGYRASLPNIRNHHRFTVPVLDALAVNRAALATNAARETPLPVTAVLRTAWDHNGAFHRDPGLAAVVRRTTHLTVMIEGRTELLDYTNELRELVHLNGDRKVDEILVVGHGNHESIEMAGDLAVTVGTTTTQAAEPVSTTDTITGAFLEEIADLMRDSPDARVVLNACLTASTQVTTVLDADPVEAARQIGEAITTTPSLADVVRTKLNAPPGRVIAANGAFPPGQASLLDAEGRLGLSVPTDPALTGTKLQYVEAGADPAGVLRATLQSWGTNRVVTLEAVNRRLEATAGDRRWKQRVIHSHLQLVSELATDDARPLQALVTSAETLGELEHSFSSVETLVAGVPEAYRDRILTALATSTAWTDVALRHIPMVLRQLWLALVPGQRTEFITFLNASTYTTRDAVGLIDLDHLEPYLSRLVPALGPPAPSPPGVPRPEPSPPPRGPFLIALLYLIQRGGTAPPVAKNYVRGLVGPGRQDFPESRRVDQVLQGAPRSVVLEAAGVVGAGGTGSVPNLSTTRSELNTLTVVPLTRRVRARADAPVNAYLLPTGEILGEVPAGTALDVIGSLKAPLAGSAPPAEATYLAVERRIGEHHTVFVLESEVTA